MGRLQVAAVVLLAALPAQAEVPTWCRYIQPGTVLHRQYCVPPPPPAGALVCEGKLIQSVEFRGMCAGWIGYRRGDDLVAVCPGRTAPVGYVRLR